MYRNVEKSNTALLDRELIAQIKGIQIRAKHLVNSSFAGEYKSAFKGRGIEFDEVRQYQAGDDIRSIDWNVTARANAPFIKVFRDERELTVIFVVDVSASNRFGSVKKFKNEVSAEITALLAYTALRNNDKVGLVIFSDHVEHYIAPDKGRGHVWRLIRSILTYESNSTKTSLDVPLEFLQKVQKGRSVMFLISDFQDHGKENILKTVSRKHDLIAVSVADPLEIEIPSIGYIELEDSETGEAILINTSSKVVSDYLKHNKRSKKEESDFFNSLGVGYIQVKTDGNYIGEVIKYFRSRDKSGRN